MLSVDKVRRNWGRGRGWGGCSGKVVILPHVGFFYVEWLDNMLRVNCPGDFCFPRSGCSEPMAEGGGGKDRPLPRNYADLL